MLNKELEIAINLTYAEAQQQNLEYLTIEHLLLVLLDNKNVNEALTACGTDIEQLRLALFQFIKQNIEVRGQHSHETQPTLAFQRIIQHAVFHVQSAGRHEVDALDVLVAIFGEQDAQAAYLLQKQGINRLDIVSYISHNITQADEMDDNDQLFEDRGNREPVSIENKLEQFCTNLNQLVRDKKIDPFIGREEELTRVIQTLCRRRKNNPLLIGEAGVGKTAIVEGLTHKIESGDVPDVLANCTVYSLDIASLLSGTKYRGDFEKRLKNLLGLLEKATDAILFIDEIHTIIGAGSVSGSQVDVANMIKPILTTGRIRVIGSTTYQEHKQIFEKDKALARRFNSIDIVEPSVSDTIRILTGLKSKYERFHQVKYTQKAIETAVELSVKYINDRHLPDKAIDVLDEAGAKNTLLSNNKKKRVIGVSEIEHIIANIARIPPKTVSSDDRSQLELLDKHLSLFVFGQDDAIGALSDAIKISRAGLAEDNKPIGSFLFAGPTGVGKTEVTIQLAKALTIPLIRFDMSEYREAHTVSRLIGSPPGYVGFEQGGLLTDAVMKQPHAVLLLDEIEKAHPDVFNLLLQIMDNGTLTDSNGRKADFRNIILVMTTNAGVNETLRKSIGFSLQDNSPNAMIEINRTFSPEFRNRLNSIIWFKHLTESVIEQIVDKFIVELQSHLDARSVSLEVNSAAKKWLSNKGYDKAMGARPMSRIIQEYIKKPLANEILFGKLAQGGGATKITLNADKLKITIISRKANKANKVTEEGKLAH